MRDFSGCAAVFLFTPPLLLQLPVGVLIFALERISRSLLLSETNRNFRGGTYEVTVYGPASTDSNNSTNTVIDLRINQSPTYATLGTCCVSYVVIAIGLFGIWELRKMEGTPAHHRMWSWLVLISNMIMIGLSAGIMGYTSSVQSNENGWQRYEDVGQSDPRLTRETWACQIDKFYPDSGWAGAACGTAKATRYLLIALAVSSALVIVSLWMLVRERGGMKWLAGGRGRYGGFENTYEMQPNTSYAFQPAPQWSPQLYQQQSPQAYQQPPDLYQPYSQAPGQQSIPQPSYQAPYQPGPVSNNQDATTKTGLQTIFR
ncbi:hypothetical protein HBI48_146770 [Parastagonospora nodorum]|nr:hypothetical protein HBI48_146770 [Parastagonospora nodorum]